MVKHRIGFIVAILSAVVLFGVFHDLRGVYSQDRQLPDLVWLGEGPGTYERSADSTSFVVKTYRPYRAKVVTDTTYESQLVAKKSEVIWQCTNGANCTDRQTTAFDDELLIANDLAPGEQIIFPMLDYDEDGRLIEPRDGYGGSPLPGLEITKLMTKTHWVTYTNVTTGVITDLIFYSEDSIIIYEENRQTVTPEPTATWTTTPEPTSTRHVLPTPTPTWTATPSATPTRHVLPPTPTPTATEPPPDQYLCRSVKVLLEVENQNQMLGNTYILSYLKGDSAPAGALAYEFNVGPGTTIIARGVVHQGKEFEFVQWKREGGGLEPETFGTEEIEIIVPTISSLKSTCDIKYIAKFQYTGNIDEEEEPSQGCANTPNGICLPIIVN